MPVQPLRTHLDRAMIRPPFPGAYWFAAAAVIGIIRIIADASRVDGVWLTIFVLMVIGFYRFATRMPDTEKEHPHGTHPDPRDPETLGRRPNPRTGEPTPGPRDHGAR